MHTLNNYSGKYECAPSSMSLYYNIMGKDVHSLSASLYIYTAAGILILCHLDANEVDKRVPTSIYYKLENIMCFSLMLVSQDATSLFQSLFPSSLKFILYSSRSPTWTAVL